MNSNWFRGLLAVALVVGVAVGVVNPALGVFLFVGEITTAGDHLSEAMKVIFEDSITETFITDTELLDVFEQDANIKVDETTGGRYIETAQLFHLPAGVGARAEGEYIPVPQGPTVVNSRIPLRKVQATLEMTGEVFDQVRTNEGAFLNYSEKAMTYMTELMNHELDRMALGFGVAALARVNRADPDSDLLLPIDSAYGIDDYAKPFPLFQENQTIVFGPNIDGSSLRTGVSKVLDVDPASGANVITLDAIDASVADNDFIFPGDASGVSTQTATGENREPMGIHGIVDDGGLLQVFQNIDRSVYRKWQGVVFDAAAAPLTEDLLMQVDDEAFEIGKAMPSVLVFSRQATRDYWSDLKGDRSINDPRGNFEGGLNRKGLKIHLGDRTVTLRVARKLDRSVGFGLSPDTLKRFHNVGFKWDDRTGSVWNRVTDGTGRKDAFYATGYIRMELGSSNPRRNWRIDDLGDPA